MESFANIFHKAQAVRSNRARARTEWIEIKSFDWEKMLLNMYFMSVFRRVPAV